MTNDTPFEIEGPDEAERRDREFIRKMLADWRSFKRNWWRLGSIDHEERTL